ncbi:MAG TPA: hypothetical protein VEF76_14350 [Patescibacteria group bacterium]|nr:hypothetical protein [Patescibacteria group bacterium]
MTDSRDIGTSYIRTQFAAKAELPAKTIAQAEKFLTHLGETEQPSPREVKTGQKILHTLQEQTELYEFHATILAGQEAVSDKDLDKRISKIAHSAEQAERTTERLRKALQSFA